MKRRLWCIGLVTLFSLLLSGVMVVAARGGAPQVDNGGISHRDPPASANPRISAQTPYTPVTTITVDSTGDPNTSLSEKCSTHTPCTLRRAIEQANDLASGSRPVLIAFDIPTSDPGYDDTLDVWKIETIGPLSPLTGGDVIIDGDTQTGGRTTGPKIIIRLGGNDDIQLGQSSGHSHNIARGLAIQTGSISMYDDYNVVEDNWVGLSDDGESIYYINDDPTISNYAAIDGGSSSDHNVIQRNVVASGKIESFIIRGDYNTIIGNYVGTKADGTIDDVAENRRCHADAIYNNWFTGDGINISGDHNQIGGPTLAERNVIVGMLFASLDPYTTPPYGMELTGSYNTVENNTIGKDANGDERWVCGMGIYISGESNELVDNEIVNAGMAAMGLYGSTYTIDGITLRGNVAKNVPAALEFGPSPPFPLTWKTFNPAQITGMVGATVSGAEGDSSPCANCIVELFLDDGDDAVEALEPLVTTTADGSGNWSVDIGVTLAPTQGLRTTTTSAVDDQIGDRSAGTTSKFSALYPVDVTPPDPLPTPSPSPPPTFPTPMPPLTPTWPITYGTVLTVTTTVDPDDSPSYTCYEDLFGPPAPAPDGLCTLRRAIIEASSEYTPRPVLIRFEIPASDDGYDGTLDVWKIELIANLPYVKQGYVVIDGETQGSIGGRSDGPKIIVDGGSIRLGEIAGQDHNIVRGLAVQAGEIAAVTDWNIIEECWAGLTDDGQNIHYLDDDPTRSNHASIRASGSNNLVRYNATASARIVSLNVAGDDNTVSGNYVGTRADGTVPDIAFHRKCHPDAFYFNWFTGDGIHVFGNSNWLEDNVVAGMLFASPDSEVTPPDAVEVAGYHNTLKNNRIGKDTADNEVGVCGVGIYVNNRFNRFIDNEIVNTGLYGFGIFGSEISLDAITLQGNILKDVPAAIEYGPLVPSSWTNYVPADIADISGLDVSGSSGAGSPCPYCTIELFLDDGDDYVEALSPVLTTTADADGNWTALLSTLLAPDEGLRTASTTSDFGQIPDFEVGTTSDFSRLYPDGVTPPLPTPTPTLSGPETVPPIAYLAAPEPPPTYSTVITVTSGSDPDPSPSTTCYQSVGIGTPASPCTLRRAIVEASKLSELQPETRPIQIIFDIPTSDEGYDGTLGVWKIEPQAALPYVKGGYVTIDGSTQPGGRSTGPKIIVEGSSIRLGEIAGEDKNIARGLAVQGGEIAAVTDGNIIEDCWAGLSDDGQSIYYINDNPDQANFASIRASGDNNLIQNNVSASAQGVTFNIAGNDNIVTSNYGGTRADGTISEVPANRRCHADALFYNWFTGDGIHVGGARNRIEDNVLAGMLFASLDPEVTAPDAMEVTGHHNLIRNNRIGVDANGEEVGVCGIGVYVNNGYNQFIDNQIADTGSFGFGIFGSGISLDATMLQGNTLKDVPSSIEFGPLVPDTRAYFNGAEVTNISGLDVSGTSGPDWSAGYDGPSGPSFCPFCRVELFLDDGDEEVEALELVGVADADADGNWSTTLSATLAPTQGLRAASTVRNFDVIESFEISTTTRFSPLYPAGVTPPDPEPQPTPLPPQTVPSVDYLPVPEPPLTYGTTITVTTAADPDTSPSYTCYGTYTGGASPPGDGLCTLRRAIVEASKVATRPVHIKFNIPTSDASYDGTLEAWTIALSGALPNVKGDRVVIDGDSQSVMGGRSDGPTVILHGSDLKLGQVAGEDEHVVRGLALQMGGIYLYGDRNIVESNWIGLNDDGQTIYYDQDDPSRSNDAIIYGTSHNNLIQDNVVATSILLGIDLQGDDNVVLGNYVGTRADGTLPDDISLADLCVSDATTNWWTGAGLDITGNRNRIQNNVIAGMLSPTPSSTPPAAVNIDGWYNIFDNNSIGKDANGQDVWICGQAVDVSGYFNQIVSNTITTTLDTGWYVFGVWGADTSLDGLTMRGNTFANFDTAIVYGPTVPESLRNFSPALVTLISDTLVTGISDDDCPYCIVDLYLDDDDDTTDGLAYLGHTVATVSGDWSFTMTTPLTEGYGLRTVSTVRNFGIIENFEIGTSSKFSILFKERPPMGPSSVEISGPSGQLVIEEAYTFVASVSPAISVTLPVDYVWQATDQVSQTGSGGTENDVAFTWDTPGTKAITVTASNAYGSEADTYEIYVTIKIVETFEPGVGGTIAYTDTRGLGIHIEVLGDALSEITTFEYTPASEAGEDPGEFVFAGRAFDLDASAPISGSITITLDYHDDDLASAGIAAESTLSLYYWTGSAWDDVANTCDPISDYVRDAANNRLSVAVCHLTRFGVFSGKMVVYLPTVLRNS